VVAGARSGGGGKLRRIERSGQPRKANAAGSPKAPGGDGYILFCGTLEPRKNLGVLLDAYELLASGGKRLPPLVIAGKTAESGRLVTGDKVMPARVTLVATITSASENGPISGTFTLSRTGPAQSSLTVNLQITGSAANGVDYTYVNPQATFVPSERSLTIEIAPYVDAITELSEVVQIGVLPGTGYVVGSPATAQLTIEDAETHAIVGQCGEATNEVTEGLALNRDNATIERASRVLAWCGSCVSSSALSAERMTCADCRPNSMVTCEPR